jgi:hypothetical protein
MTDLNGGTPRSSTVKMSYSPLNAEPRPFYSRAIYPDTVPLRPIALSVHSKGLFPPAPPEISPSKFTSFASIQLTDVYKVIRFNPYFNVFAFPGFLGRKLAAFLDLLLRPRYRLA